MRKLANLVFLFATILTPLAAQSTSASIVGTIRDPHSAAVPGAVVSAANPERGWEAKAITDEAGSYTFYPVPPGLYRMTIEARGRRDDQRDRVDGEDQEGAVQDWQTGLQQSHDARDLANCAGCVTRDNYK